jgi:hypothetical protein
MPIAKSVQNTSILEYALHHLEKEAAEIQGKIDHIRRQLGQKVASVAAAAAAPATEAAASAPRKRRVLSAAARKRIAAAQKKRWAEHRKAKTVKPGKSE